ncbi:MAG TPA: MMPL family transporter, partial [Frankiaceae bacterium]|nr:MMPL family transporter [Frankiaceae bacterium]
RPRLVLAVTVVLVALAAVFGGGAVGKLKGGGFDDPGSDSTRAQEELQARFGGQPDLLLLVRARSGTADSPAVAAAGRELTTRLAGEPGLSDVTSYWATGAPTLKSRDGRSALVLAHVVGEDKAASERTKELVARYAPGRGGDPAVTVLAGGAQVAGNDIGDQVSADLAVAEAIAIPITLVLLLLAFGSLVAALLPLAIGIVAIFGTLAVLSVLGSLTDVSIYALNLTTAMSLGLSIDYALLMVSRFREELANGREPRDALAATLRTAGRTIVFSAATVAVALAALLVFPLYFLRSFAYAGIAVVLVAMIGAIVVLPALLAVLGRRVDALRVLRREPAGAEAPFWRRTAALVMRRPLLAGLPVVALLLVLGVPFLHVSFGTPDDRVLPTGKQSRQVGDALRADFATNDAAALYVVTDGDPGPAGLAPYAAGLSRLPDVARVETATGTYATGRQVAPPTPPAARFERPGGAYLSVVAGVDPKSGRAQSLVRDVREVAPPAGVRALVGGPSAALVDGKDAVGSRLPLAIGLIALTTFVLLFLFTGSVMLPAKALALNVLGLAAVLGAMVWVFQDGHLSGVLGFTPTPLDTSMPVLLFCIAFGLSMDYEVFLLSRIKELRDAGASNEEAVAGGLARTGRIVSTAAALLAVTFFAFGTSKVSFIQLFGIGTGIAILLDATLVRGVLVPAFMRLTGRANWWAPAPLRRLHARVGLRESRPAPPSAFHSPAA